MLLAYLWGMETNLLLFDLFLLLVLLAYLWGMETSAVCNLPADGYKVVSLPMRDGNWKDGMFPLLYPQLLAYLWGMETLFRFDWIP